MQRMGFHTVSRALSVTRLQRSRVRPFSRTRGREFQLDLGHPMRLSQSGSRSVEEEYAKADGGMQQCVPPFSAKKRHRQ